MTIETIQKRLLEGLNSKEFEVLTIEEYLKEFPEQKDDWEPGDYLLVVDKKGGQELLSGAYSIECEDESFIGVWLPYPEEPITNIEEFIKELNNLK